MSILDTVDWSIGANALIKQSYEISNSPTILILRHSAREFTDDIREDQKCPLTPIGRDAALEFGAKLNPKKKYRIFYSPVQRCKDTGLFIQEGLKKNNASVQFMHEIPSLVKIGGDPGAFAKYFDRDYIQIMSYWFAGFYPPWEMEPALRVAQRLATEVTQNVTACESETIDLYVGHDLTVITLLHYWSGITATNEWINFMDGFFLQTSTEERKLHIFFKGEEKISPYPYWWPK
jgi:broad specificity phosphatase PhoE